MGDRAFVEGLLDEGAQRHSLVRRSRPSRGEDRRIRGVDRGYPLSEAVVAEVPNTPEGPLYVHTS